MTAAKMLEIKNFVEYDGGRCRLMIAELSPGYFEVRIAINGDNCTNDYRVWNIFTEDAKKRKKKS